jgi:osmotically inducible lipoprotein OsmB
VQETDMSWKAGLAAALLLALTACGSSKMDRGLSGGAIGAGVGAATGAATGGSVLGGAALGGAAGAATGVLTDEDDVDLGEPVWNR